jgi:hypothetical protein
MKKPDLNSPMESSLWLSPGSLNAGLSFEMDIGNGRAKTGLEQSTVSSNVYEMAAKQEPIAAWWITTMRHQMHHR